MGKMIFVDFGTPGSNDLAVAVDDGKPSKSFKRLYDLIEGLKRGTTVALEDNFEFHDAVERNRCIALAEKRGVRLMGISMRKTGPLIAALKQYDPEIKTKKVSFPPEYAERSGLPTHGDSDLNSVEVIRYLWDSGRGNFQLCRPREEKELSPMERYRQWRTNKRVPASYGKELASELPSPKTIVEELDDRWVIEMLVNDAGKPKKLTPFALGAVAASLEVCEQGGNRQDFDRLMALHDRGRGQLRALAMAPGTQGRVNVLLVRYYKEVLNLSLPEAKARVKKKNPFEPRPDEVKMMRRAARRASRWIFAKVKAGHVRSRNGQ